MSGKDGIVNGIHPVAKGLALRKQPFDSQNTPEPNFVPELEGMSPEKVSKNFTVSQARYLCIITTYCFNCLLLSGTPVAYCSNTETENHQEAINMKTQKFFNLPLPCPGEVFRGLFGRVPSQKAREKFCAAVGISLLGFLVGLPTSAGANVVSIDINFNSLAKNANNSSVQNYIRALLAAGSAGTVTVTGAKALTDYDGDNHVVGPLSGSNGHTVTSETLGTSDGGVHHNGGLDAFLANSGADRITMLFSSPVYGVSFDYEIFPDGTCARQGTGCQPNGTNWPDFTFRADNLVVFETLGIVPGQSGTYLHSPNSRWNHSELAPQYLGTSGEWLFPNGVTKLEFVDWPVMIGIDNLNLQVEDPPNGVPEPSSLVLAAVGLALLGYRRRHGRPA